MGEHQITAFISVAAFNYSEFFINWQRQKVIGVLHNLFQKNR